LHDEEKNGMVLTRSMQVGLVVYSPAAVLLLRTALGAKKTVSYVWVHSPGSILTY